MIFFINPRAMTPGPTWQAMLMGSGSPVTWYSGNYSCTCAFQALPMAASPV